MAESNVPVPRRHLTVTPAYDPVARLWFVDEFPGKEATRIRELLVLLPAGTKLTNYYPNGAPIQRFNGNAGDMVSAAGHLVSTKRRINSAGFKR